MKYIHLYLTYFLCLITSLIYTGCKDDESELIPNTFEISSSDLNKEIDFRSTTMSIPVKQICEPANGVSIPTKNGLQLSNRMIK